MSHAPNCVNDVKAIGELRRKMFGDNIFNIKPDAPEPIKCQWCDATYNGVLWIGTCAGTCQDGD